MTDTKQLTLTERAQKATRQLVICPYCKETSEMDLPAPTDGPLQRIVECSECRKDFVLAYGMYVLQHFEYTTRRIDDKVHSHDMVLPA